MEKKKLILVTQGFPFGESERGFLTEEFRILTARFQVSILAVGTDQPLLYSLPDGISAQKFFYRSFSEELKHMRLGMAFTQGRPAVLREILGFGKESSPAIKMKKMKAALSYSMNAWQAQQVLDQMIQKEQADMVYTYWCTPMTLAACRLKRKHPGLTVVTRFHGIDLYEERTEFSYQPFRREISENADLLVFACQKARTYFQSHWHQATDNKCMVSYLGCQAMEAVASENSNILHLVSCSNLIPLKRVDGIIKALALLPEKIRVDWHHIGDGSLRRQLEEDASVALSDKSNIQWKFHGAVPHHQLNKLYRELQADVFITTSSTEGLPVSVQEALAMKIPAIATDVGGMSELVLPERTGWLLSANPEPAETASAIEAASLVQNRIPMKEEAYLLWERSFDSEKNADHFAEILLSLLTDKERNEKII